MPGTSEVRTPTKTSAADEIKQLRRACKHAFHFVILFLASVDNRRVGSILSTLTRVTESWYTKQAGRLKSYAENHDWVLGIATHPTRRTLVLLGSSSRAWSGGELSGALGSLMVGRTGSLVSLEVTSSKKRRAVCSRTPTKRPSSLKQRIRNFTMICVPSGYGR
jgi:hypothetical protein